MKYCIGENACFAKTISESDIYLFAGITGDFNPVHINEIDSSKTIFKKRICHGMLAGSFISTVLGMKFPGPGTVYLEQNLKFVRPVYIGDTLEAYVEIIKIINSQKHILKLMTNVRNQEKEYVIEGSCIVKAP